MTEERVLWFLTSAAIILLLFMAAFSSGVVVASVGGILALVGLLLLPRYRRRGSLALLIGVAFAALVVAAIRLVG